MLQALKSVSANLFYGRGTESCFMAPPKRGFPEMGVPPNHPFIDRMIIDYPLETIQLWGYPHLWTPMWYIYIYIHIYIYIYDIYIYIWYIYMAPLVCPTFINFPGINSAWLSTFVQAALLRWPFEVRHRVVHIAVAARVVSVLRLQFSI